MNKPGWRESVNEVPEQAHWWDGKKFAPSGRPVAECFNEIELYPKFANVPFKRKEKCNECYRRHNVF